MRLFPKRASLTRPVRRMLQLASLGAASLSLTQVSVAQVQNYRPVTQEMLENPDPADWLMFSRTYDAQRYSPLKQITKDNVGKLKLAWSHELTTGTTETVPIVHDGVIYTIVPPGNVMAFDGVNGNVLWEYKAEGRGGNSKTLAIFGDIVAYTAPQSKVIGLDARTGEVRWTADTDGRGHSSGPIVAEGMVISGGSCGGNRAACYIAAHDALTGKEVWRFYTTPTDGEPGAETWNGNAVENRQASTWGMPGAYDVAQKKLIWGVANPMPDTRMQRHNGDPDGTGRKTPADLYSNSTLSIDVKTGKLDWYYQHLPGDDWDMDQTNERTLARVAFNPDPKFVKWINPNIQRGSMHNISANIGEGGGLAVLDRDTGEFLWATPFPFDTPNFNIADIDPATGQATLNWDQVAKGPGETHIICFWNTKSYWPAAYSPETQSLYTSYIDNCRQVSSPKEGERFGPWSVIPRPGGNPDELTGMAKINLSTGETLMFDKGRAPGNGASLATAGGLIFHGDMSGKLKAFDAANGKELWQSQLGGNVSVSTITYGVNGKQYIAVLTGDNPKVPELSAEVPELQTPAHNELYVFALPE